MVAITNFSTNNETNFNLAQTRPTKSFKPLGLTQSSQMLRLSLESKLREAPVQFKECRYGTASNRLRTSQLARAELTCRNSRPRFVVESAVLLTQPVERKTHQSADSDRPAGAVSLIIWPHFRDRPPLAKATYQIIRRSISSESHFCYNTLQLV
jgi:hypothetical protein